MTIKDLMVLPGRRWLAVGRWAAGLSPVQAVWTTFQALALGSIALLTIGVLWRQESRGPEHSPDTAALHGQTVQARSFPELRRSWPALGDPRRVQQLLRPGHTYVVHTKAGLVGQTQGAEGFPSSETQNFALVFETIIHRTIEANDGRRIVEVRHVRNARTALLLSTARLELDLGEPGLPLLDQVANIDVDARERWTAGAPLAATVLKGGAESIASDQRASAMLDADLLAGKKVRLTYIDGVGIESIRPIGCDLSTAELQYLLAAPVLHDGYLVPWPSDGKRHLLGPGRREQLTGLLSPALAQVELGDMIVQPMSQQRWGAGGPREFQLTAEHRWGGPAGQWLPQGRLLAASGDGRILTARMRWPLQAGPAAALVGPLFRQVYRDRQSGLAAVYSCSRRLTIEEGGVPAPLQDLALGLIALLGASAGLVWGGLKTAHLCSRRMAQAIAAATVVGILVFGAWVHKAVWLAELLPTSNVIILGNWLPLGAAYFAGILFAQRMIPWWRRAAIACLVVTLAGYTAIGDLTLVTDPTCRSVVRDEVCVQTLPETCSPCSAVTLLHHHGIEANEAEMTRLCLTRQRGTSLLGLYRGLKLKTQGTPWDVEVVRCSVQELCDDFRSPVLLRVQNLPLNSLTPDAGWPSGDWSPDVEHSVVLLGVSGDGGVEIGDPASSLQPRSKWTVEDLEKRWQGEGFRLVLRDGPRG